MAISATAALDRFSILANFGLRLIVLTRHPLDRLISQLAWERALGGPLPCRTKAPQQLARELILSQWDGRPWHNGYVVADYAAVHNYYLRELVSDWMYFRPCLMVKFEQLIAYPFEVLTECLDHLRVSASKCEVKRATQLVNFQSLSDGRRPGQADPLSHYRCGIPGEWSGVFASEDIKSMRPKCADAFSRAGYAL
jgi:hypothetical protein